MNSDHVKASVACYFRYERQCPIISFERSVSEYFSNPDILVVNKDRKIIEIEVKVSIADFKNDTKKRIWLMRNNNPDKYMPYQFYYAVPSKLREKALIVLNGWREDGKIEGNSGLIVVQDSSRIGVKDCSVNKKAPLNKNSKRLSVKKAIKMVYNQSGTLCSSAVRLAKTKNELKNLKELHKPIPPKKPKKPKNPKKSNK